MHISQQLAFVLSLSLFLPLSALGGRKQDATPIETAEAIIGDTRVESAYDMAVLDADTFVVAVQRTEISKSARVMYDTGLLWLNAKGEVQKEHIWEYDDRGREPAALIRTNSGDLLVAGNALQNFGRVAFGWVSLLSKDGEVLWEVFPGEGTWGELLSVTEIESNRFIAAGKTTTEGDRHIELWLVTLDAKGNVIAELTKGTASRDDGEAVFSLSDGGVVVLGSTMVNYDFQTLVVLSSPDTSWVQTYPGNVARAGIENKSGELVIASSPFSGFPLASLLFLDKTGAVKSQQELGKLGKEVFDLAQTKTGYVGVGSARGNQERPGGAWVFGTNARGEILWEHQYGEQGEKLVALELTSDGGMAAVGRSKRNDKNGDIWFLKLDDKGAFAATP
jgi:hypothetical protein